MSDTRVKFTLGEDEIPTKWTNLLPDLAEPPPPPPLHPGTQQPVGPDDLAPLFAPGLIAQEVSTEPEIEIPDAVREVSSCGARRRSTGRTGSSASSTRPRTSTTSTRASRRPGRTSRTPPSRRHTRTRPPASES